ncbi:5'-methylthioadenosine/adenosylhomocysteine nucleosidase [Fibrella forsythiae]|uniref:adenosylhomocysteine nucleosidase n=1 Tax=Fibrella forsythiae TaxID=2817061 RepID=A0ABS3JGJ6_9BACT|nr:5'-methylthioadenosine/adenosylhomocysteine nucleosidase [Fibrella forsythiae]MBO0949135.1 5'-methylthioadenosine/adenosylhomocysteine nucleosidase [Fibrella forsythiae]
MRFLLALLFVVITQCSHAQAYQTESITALLGAFGPEVELVEKRLQNPVVVMKNGIRFVTGRLGTQQVVVALTGIGKTNAAMTTAFALAYFRPRQVIFTGIAGGVSPDLQPGDLVVGRETGYHDYHWTTFDNKPTNQTRNLVTNELNPGYFPGDSALLLLALQTAKSSKLEPIPGLLRAPIAVAGRIVTGDEFVNSEQRVNQLRTEHQADATEMEGAAVAQICYQQGIPCIVIRSLSDKANSSARTDMRTFLGIAARNSAQLVVSMMEASR